MEQRTLPAAGRVAYQDRPWIALYHPSVPACIEADIDAAGSMVELFERDATRFADRPGFVSLGTERTYGEMLADAKAFAAWLADIGIARGDRVAIMMPNCLQYPVALFGTLFAGAIVVNVNPLYTARELAHQLRDSGARAIVVMDMFAATLEAAREELDLPHVVVTAMGDMLGGIKGALVSFAMRDIQRLVPRYRLPDAIRWKTLMRRARRLPFRHVPTGPEDIAFLQYTGGTSGVAKGAMLTNRNVVANTLQGRAWVTPQLDPEEALTNVTLLPLYHIFSLTANLLMFGGAGGRNILIANPRDAKRVVWILRNERFAGFAGVSTLFAGLLDQPGFRARDFTKLKLTIAGGMATPGEIARRWQATTDKPLVEGYGLTECSPVVCVGVVDLANPGRMGHDGTVGVPVPSTEVRMRREDGSWADVGEPGELCVRGPQVMKGYWNRPEETAKVLSADGWLGTGDVGVFEPDGRIRIVDRIKDLIVVSGFNVYPAEVEDVIADHPLVAEVAVVGVPDPVQGERVRAIIYPRGPGLTVEAIQAHCRARLTAYKVPRIVEFSATELPKSTVGKILRRELR